MRTDSIFNYFSPELMKKDTFEDFLQEKHAEQYCGLDDDMPDDCSEWIANLDPDEFIFYGDMYGITQYKAALKFAQELVSNPKT
jgi:hypothetical protein